LSVQPITVAHRLDGIDDVADEEEEDEE